MFRFDLLRGGAQGVFESCWQTFALVVLIRVFAADESIKRNIPAAYGYGLILAPFILAWVGRRPWSAPKYAASLWVAMSVALVCSAFVRDKYIFLGALVFAQMCGAQAMPVFTHLYSQNYPPRERGKRLSSSVLVTSVMGVVFGFTGGFLLDLDPVGLSAYPVIFLIGAVAAAIGAWAISRMPGEPVNTLSSGSLWENIQFAWRDWVFRWLLLGWMLMGMGNLMLIPLRVEYLANESYGINASNTEIAFLMAVIVPVFRLLSTFWWGMIFDRLNLITVRLGLNGFFLISMYLFFFSDSLWVMGVGAAILGIAFGGGSVMWTLWVTKIAPPGKVSVYMSVHGFFTGLRGSAAPFFGYALLQAFGPRPAAVGAMCLIVLSSLIFLPLRPVLERYRRGEIQVQ